MKLEAFGTLNAVLRCGSFAAAATEMNLSPSAVSLQMKHMEAYFGQPLFDRSSLSARPTAFAREVNDAVQETLQRLDGLRRRHSPALAGRVRLGTIEPLQVSLMPALLRCVAARYPQLDVRPVRGRVSELVDQLNRGEIDAAIITQPETGGSRRLSWTPLAKEKLIGIAPLAARTGTLAECFAAYEWIRFDRSTVGGRIAARYVAKHAPEARSRIDVQSLAALTAMVSEGLGVSVLPDPGPGVLQVHPVRVLPLGKNGPSRQIAFACRLADQDNRLVQALLDGARSAYAERV